MNSPIDLSRIELLDSRVITILKKKTSFEKLAMAFESNRLVRLRLAAHFQMQHPDWNDVQIQAAVAGRVMNGTS